MSGTNDRRRVVDDQYDELLKTDKQLQFAFKSIENYYNAKDTDLVKDALILDLKDSTSNIRRHIVNVDDISRINYEMIKNAPGNLVASEHENDVDIDLLKTKMFKNNLYELNDTYLNLINWKNSIREEQSNENDDNLNTDLPSLNDQIEYLYQIQEKLLKQYNSMINNEKKWFTLRELLLDANIELDLFSTNESNPKFIKINLGDKNLQNSQSFANTLAFNRPKRQKLNNGKPSNIL
ncbi:hypothetical protein KAFR_0C03390 [Kazachstania africana CBS 2517]|uniref:Uncharacterized protein n=1 Tax=Kazachstania africana (strain ATCC 22294 / BCRC 22015 / CBS 2517 / CECT 1963 / NBRC 1671 / NRRL Y-8276) TaxID=1071382 RepID=H2ASI1_KAZAF|nr:hypothetical protein KAFR_0C03390 [Kazachstania africana CBS 2517]CCF57331.1 hypothetical protein KAFR_0C03390 [Kazachstania africana CBS 2517]